MAEIGSARSGSGKAGLRALFRSASLPAICALMLILSACSSETPYPDLGSVSPSQETASALEERRQIVRDLIDDRDLARHNEAVVRHRSGLSDVPPPAAPASTTTRAEDIVRHVPLDADPPTGQALQNETERAYRDRAQFDDGTLNDFIRNLKKDTAPGVVEQPPDDQEPLSGQSEAPQPQSWLLEGLPQNRLTGVVPGRTLSDQPIILAAFAPSALRDEGLMVIRLAADDAESGFFCSYLGWMVAWSDTCLEEGEEVGAPEESGDIVSGDGIDASGNQTPSAKPNEPAADETGTIGRDVVAPRRSQPDDEVVASEDIDSNGSSLIAGPLERLRNLLRSRSPRSETPSAEPRSLSYEAEALRPPKDQGPPLPRSRPEVEKDLRIVRNDNVFEFTRTPRPAFKPVQVAQNTVIFPPLTPRQAKKTTPLPTAKPEQAAAGQGATDEVAPRTAATAGEDVAVAVLEDLDQAKKGRAPGSGSAAGAGKEKTPELPDQQPRAAIPGIAEPKDPTLLDSEIITFAPGSADLPIGLKGRLGSMLRKAKAKDGKLYIVSEAEIGSLAMERARGIGLALVHLGATADLIEYDIVTAKDTDQVTLQLKLDAQLIQERTDASDP